MNATHSDQVILFHDLVRDVSQLTKEELMMHRAKIYLVLTDHEPVDSESKVYSIYILFEYLLTEDFLELIRQNKFGNFRIMIIKKINELKNNPYVLKNKQKLHEFLAALAEMKSFIDIGEDQAIQCIPRRSERLKQKIIKKRNEDLKKCACNRCVQMYYDLTYNGQNLEED
jgi:hypothetical protein